MILLIERQTAHLNALVESLRAGTGWPVLHVPSSADGLQRIARKREAIKIVILTLDQIATQALQLVRQIRKLTEACGVEQPGIVALFWASQPASLLSALEDIGAECLLRRDSNQVTERVRLIQWRLRTQLGLPTLIVQRRNGHIVAIFAKGMKATAELRVGPKIRSLAGYLALNSRTAHSTVSLADALGICRQSVKEYLLRLRQALDDVRRRLGISTPARMTFWTERRPGGYVHGVTANIKFDDGTFGENPQESRFA